MAFWKRDVFSALDWEGNRTTLLGWVASEERKEEEKKEEVEEEERWAGSDHLPFGTRALDRTGHVQSVVMKKDIWREMTHSAGSRLGTV